MSIINKGVFDADTMTIRQTGSDWPTAQVITTADVTESSANLYFTNARVVTALIAGTAITIEANGRISSAGGGITPNSNVEGNLRITGTMTANAFASSGFGVPTLSSATNINLSANGANGGAVVIQNSPLRLRSYTTADRGNITAAAGDLIFNSTTLTVQDYDGTSWANVDVGSQWITTGSDIYYNTGNVGVGTATPASFGKFAIRGAANVATWGATSGHFSDGTTGSLYITHATNKVSLKTDSDLELFCNNTGDAIIFSTNAIERLRIPSDSAGITFPATQSASSDANTLDDYEEGTWTPSAEFSGGNGTRTNVDCQGRYTKVGNLVTILFYTQVTKGNASGNLSFSGLPFSAASFAFGMSVAAWNLTSVANPIAYLSNGTTFTCYYADSGSSTLTYITDVQMQTTNAVISGSFSYRV